VSTGVGSVVGTVVGTPPGALTDEQRELARVVREVLDERSPQEAVRAAAESTDGVDPALWATLAELGLPGLAVPEELGGAGAGWVEQGLVLEEMGRVPACAPYLSAVALAAPALLAAGDADAAARWLPDLAAGRLLATAAVPGDPRVPVAEAVGSVAERAGRGWRVSGDEPVVLDAATAGLLLVGARTGAGVGLFAVEPGPGARVLHRRTSDRTRRVAALELRDAPATLVGAVDDGARVLEHVRRVTAVALAREQVGGAARTLELAVAHAQQRVQFGRPIGSFQAVKHRCADVLVRVETARSAAWAAVRALETGDPDLPLVASLARAVCSEAYVRCASDAVQVHGGIGFTWEHPVSLHVKRSRGSAVLLGTPREHRAVVARLAPVLPPRTPAATPTRTPTDPPEATPS
jgi:acyl-CoA dehydrogenase